MWFEVQKKSESIRVSFRVVDNDHDLYIIGAVCLSVTKVIILPNETFWNLPEPTRTFRNLLEPYRSWFLVGLHGFPR